MKVWGLCAALLLAMMVAGCGGNSTTIGVTVTPTTAPILLGGVQPFSATVTGISTTTVFWQICLPSTSNKANVAPTVCSVPEGPAGCATLSTTPPINPLTGFGTITSTGLYTAPTQMPTTSSFDIVATSCANTSGFGIAQVTLQSGISVTVVPSAVTLAATQTFQFTADVTPNSANPAVNWTLTSPPLAPPPATNLGSISPAGLYTAPPTPAVGSITITATSVADPSKSGTAIVTLAGIVDPTIASISPTSAAEGSVQQDVYVTGTNFLTGSTLEVNGVPEPLSAITFISSTLLRVTIPGSQLAAPGTLQLQVNNGAGSLGAPGVNGLSNIVQFPVKPVRPALIGTSLQSVAQSPTASAGLTLTGGYYVPSGTTATFNGVNCGGGGGCTTFLDSRDLLLTIPAGQLGTPGLYPIVVQNSDAANAMPPVASEAALNLAVTPTASAIPGMSSAGPAVGNNPSAIAIDYVDDEAVVANEGDGTVSVINLAATPPTVVNVINVGKSPTGVAVDDLLPDPVALVVNSADQTVTAIDLTSGKKTTTCVSIASGTVYPLPVPCPVSTNPPLPFSVGINPITPQPTPQLSNGTFAPVTHRAIVAYQAANVGTVLDVSVVGGAPVVSVLQQVGAGITNYSTGQNPAIAIDPRLNWALITPGDEGTINVVDLGRDAYAPGGDSGRAPDVVANLSITPTVQGVAVNSETHQAFLTDPNAGNGSDTNGSFSTFNMLNQTVNPLQFQTGSLTTQMNFVAAAVDPLTNVGVAVNSLDDLAVVADLRTGIVLKSVTLTNAAQAVAVAVDPVSNNAIVVLKGTPGSISLVALGSTASPVVNPLQIVEANPAIAFAPTATSITPPVPSAMNLPLEITGGGFITGAGGSQVLLDGTALPGADVTVVSARRINAVIPSTMLKSARNYFVQVENPGGIVSNVTDLTVVQPVSVGTTPAGVAIDASRDLAVVTNSGGNTASLVALATTTPVGPAQVQAGQVGTFATISVGSEPVGVAVMPRLGLALVGNSESANLSLLDVTQTNPALQGVSGCNGSPCTGQLGVTIDQDSGLAAIANSSSNNVTFEQLSTGPLSALPSDTIAVDLFPTALAIDPVINLQVPGAGLAALTTASQSSSIEFLNTPSAATAEGRVSGLALPTDIIFDSLNQVFMAVDSLGNELDIIDPHTFQATTVLVGINPTSLDYNFQTSTAVTLNSASHTISMLEYVCPPPPNGVPADCPAPQVKAILGVGGSQSLSSVPIDPEAIAVDPRLNIAVVVDPGNNRILLVPALH
jgi:DNA-binding beta-propeller fold protein YncE